MRLQFRAIRMIPLFDSYSYRFAAVRSLFCRSRFEAMTDHPRSEPTMQQVTITHARRIIRTDELGCSRLIRSALLVL